MRIHSFFASAAMCMGPSSATLATDTCTSFGLHAFAEFRALGALECTPGDIRFTYDETQHAAWCRTHGAGAAKADAAARRNLLTACLNRPAEIPDCYYYGQRATYQIEAATHLGCPVSGERWRGSFRSHVDWCLGQPKREAMLEEDEARRRELKACLARRP